MKISACNEFFEGWPIEKILDYISNIGYDGVEISPFTLANSVKEISQRRRSEISRSARDSGVEIVGLHWLLVSPEGLYINHRDPKIRLSTQEYMCELIRFCGDLDGKVMVLGSPKQRAVQEGWDYNEIWNLTKEVIGQCMETAEEREVTLCIEPLSKNQTNFINTADEAVKLVEEISHPNLKLMVDVCSASTEEKPVAQIIRDVKDHLAHVHVNDANGRGPGFGEVDFVPILQALKDISYDGYISVEVFDFKPDPETIATESLEYLRGILRSLAY